MHRVRSKLSGRTVNAPAEDVEAALRRVLAEEFEAHFHRVRSAIAAEIQGSLKAREDSPEKSVHSEDGSLVLGPPAAVGGNALWDASGPESFDAAEMVARDAHSYEHSQPLLSMTPAAGDSKQIIGSALGGCCQELGTKELPAPEDSACPILVRVVDSWQFQAFITAVIVINCVFLSLGTDAEMENCLHGQPVPGYLKRADHVFAAIFTVELCLKLARSQWLFFYGIDYMYNFLDLILVMICFTDLLMEKTSVTSSLRMLRFLRLARILRVMKLVASVKPLRAILECILCSGISLISSVFVLGATVFMGALTMVLLLETYLGDAVEEEHDLEKLTGAFGSMYKAMYTMGGYALGGGDWILEFSTLESVGWVPQLTLVIYMIFSQLALLNVISAIFLDTAMKNMVEDLSERAKEHQQEQQQIMQYISRELGEVDEDGDGTISKEEWDHAVARGLLAHLESVGLRASDASEVFGLFADNSEDGRVSMQALTDACIGFKGVATPFNVLRVLFNLRAVEGRLRRDIRKIANRVDVVLSNIE